MPIVTATFETRREAELAVEHLVQEHSIERDDISVGPEGDENSVGVEASGADASTELEDGDDDEAALASAILVTVTAEGDEEAEEIAEYLEEFGGGDVAVGE